MPGYVTYDATPPGMGGMSLATAPSLVTQQIDPMETVEQLGRVLRRDQAEFGITDPNTGEMIQGPEPTVAPDVLNRRYRIDGPTPALSLSFAHDMPESVAADMNAAKRDEILRANAQGAAPHTFANTLGVFGLGMLDPIGLAASAMPVFGEARAAQLLGRLGLAVGEGFAGRTAARAVAGAISGAGANVPVAALRYGLSQQEGMDYGFYEAARDVAYGAPMGAVLHPLGGALVDLLGHAREYARTPSGYAGTPPDYAGAASHFDAPDANAAAMQAATAAVMEDRPVDVAPVAAAAAPVAIRETYPVFTPGGMRIEARPEVVPLDSLIASHGPDGSVNPAYPAELGLQPRDRSSFTSQEQVRAIAADLQPERLGPSPEAASGAPIVSPAGVVESGNGRVAALRLVYEDPALAAQAERYQGFLRDQGHAIDGIDKPVLIGRRVTDLNDAQVVDLARGANERTTLDMTAAEQAGVDADRAGRALDLWRGSDVHAAANSDFVRSFIAQLPETERGRFRTKDGGLSADGARRIESAVMAHAYGDALGPTLARFLNGDTEGMRAISGALSDAAAAWGRLRRAAADGTIPRPLDLTDALGEAVRLVDHARRSNRPLADFIHQTDFERAPPSAEALALTRLFFRDDAMRKPIAREKLADLLRAYATEAQKVQPGPDMFGTAPARAADILHALARGDTVREQAALAFAGRGEGAEPTPHEAELAKLAVPQRAALEAAYARAAVAKPGFDETLRQVADAVGGELQAAPLKGARRAVEKVLADYGGDASRIKDLLRATIVVDTPAQAARALAALREQMAVRADGFRDMVGGTPGADGYRDIKMNVNVGGITAEVHVNVRPMLEAKTQAHALYEQAQAIKRQAIGREPTENELSRVAALEAQQRVIYDAAFERASKASRSARADTTSLSNSAREIGAPLREAEPGSNDRGGSVSQATVYPPEPGSASDTGTPSTSRNLAAIEPSASELPARTETVKSQDRELAGQIADAEQSITHARVAGLLSKDDDAELARIDDTAATTQGHQDAIAQAGACVARGL